MDVKYTIQGLLIYEAMGFYILSLLVARSKVRKVSLALYALGFIASIMALIYRGTQVNHFPLQNLFEVFLFLGAMVFPITLLSMKLLKTKDYISDVIIGIIILFPAGFVFSAQPQQLPPALQSVLFVPHVLAYMLAYIIFTKAATLAGKQLLSHNEYETLAFKLVCVGFPLLTLGLILGSIWGKLAWGDFWNWDPKEMWSLATWLVYAGYFHFRARFSRYKKANAVWIIAGFCFIVITLLWANLSRIFAGLHNYT